MENQYLSILIGFIIIVLIVNTTAIFSIASDQGLMSSGQPRIPVSAVTSVSSPRDEVVSASPSPTPIAPAITPTVPPIPVPVVQPTEVPAPVPTQIGLEIIYQTPSVITTPAPIQPAIPVESTAGYVTIYSLNDAALNTNFPSVSFPLANPPLIIDYEVKPVNVTDIKVLDYKLKETQFHDTVTIKRPYENTWFVINVRDRDTGEIVETAGYGRTYGLQTPGQLKLYKSGNYLFEFDGDYVNVTLTMKVKPEGNPVS